MKNIIHKLKFITVAALTLSLGACDAILEEDILDYGATPVLVQFVNNSETANFIQGDDNPVYTHEVEVTLVGGRNQPINEPVTVTVAVDPSSTAVEGQEFNLLTETVTIPAGEMTAAIQLEVLSGNLDAFDPKTVVLDITSSSITISENSDTAIVLQAACEYDPTGFYGTYDAVQSGILGSKTFTVEVSEGPAPNTLLLKGLNGSATTETVIELNTDPTNPTVTYRSQEFGAVLYVHSVYGDAWATTITPGNSSYGSCDNALNLNFKLCVGAGCFGGSITVNMVKQ